MQIESRTCQACLGNYAEMQLCLFKEEKMGLRCQSSASIRHPRFLLFPLLEKGLSKKGKISLMYRTSSWREQRSTLNDSLALPSSVVTRDSPNEFGALHSLLRPFTITNGTVHFYRECKRVVLSVWDREQFYFCISSLFPFCIIISQQIAILWPKYKKNMFKVNFYVWFTLKVVASCRFPNYFQ